METIRAQFPDEGRPWKRAVLEKASVLFAPRKRFVMAEVTAMLVVWLLPVLVGVADVVARVAGFLALLPWAINATLVTALAGAAAAFAHAYRGNNNNNPQFRDRVQQLHPLALAADNPAGVVFLGALCVPGVLHVTNAHRFGVACLELLVMLPAFLARLTAEALVVDPADHTLTLVLTFSPTALLRLLHHNARVAQALHVLAICWCSFFKMLLGASYARTPASLEGRRARYIAALGSMEKAFLVAMLAWPVLVVLELLWFPDLDPWDLVMREEDKWWLVKCVVRRRRVVARPAPRRAQHPTTTTQRNIPPTQHPTPPSAVASSS
jgi:hypothetical protein